MGSLYSPIVRSLWNRPIYLYDGLGTLTTPPLTWKDVQFSIPLTRDIKFTTKGEEGQSAHFFTFCILDCHQTGWKIKNLDIKNSPFHNTSAPARLRLPVPHVSTKPLKSSLSLHAKILFCIWNERVKYCNRYYYEVNWSVLHVNC